MDLSADRIIICLLMNRIILGSIENSIIITVDWLNRKDATFLSSYHLKVYLFSYLSYGLIKCVFLLNECCDYWEITKNQFMPLKDINLSKKHMWHKAVFHAIFFLIYENFGLRLLLMSMTSWRHFSTIFATKALKKLCAKRSKSISLYK